MQIQCTWMSSSESFTEGRGVGFAQSGSSGDRESDLNRIYLMKEIHWNRTPNCQIDIAKYPNHISTWGRVLFTQSGFLWFVGVFLVFFIWLVGWFCLIYFVLVFVVFLKALSLMQCTWILGCSALRYKVRMCKGRLYAAQRGQMMGKQRQDIL